jgi:transcriptional regulator with XRE-family HTH domain
MAYPAPALARRRLAANARALRARMGWTQEAAAERIDCSVQALQRMERAAAAVTIDFVSKLAAAYRVDIGELFAAAPGPWRAPVVGRPRLADAPAIAAAESRGPRYASARKAKRRRP